MEAVFRLCAIVAIAKISVDILMSFTFLKLFMIVASVVILAFCFFSLRRSDETKELLQEGIRKSLDDIETEDVSIDLKRFGRHMRYIIMGLSLTSLAYWLTVKAYVSMALGLTGAILVFAEFVLNFEVVYFLTSDPSATLSKTGAAQVISFYKVISVFHMTAIMGVILTIVM